MNVEELVVRVGMDAKTPPGVRRVCVLMGEVVEETIFNRHFVQRYDVRVTRGGEGTASGGGRYRLRVPETTDHVPVELAWDVWIEPDHAPAVVAQVAQARSPGEALRERIEKVLLELAPAHLLQAAGRTAEWAASRALEDRVLRTLGVSAHIRARRTDVAVAQPVLTVVVPDVRILGYPEPLPCTVSVRTTLTADRVSAAAAHERESDIRGAIAEGTRLFLAACEPGELRDVRRPAMTAQLLGYLAGVLQPWFLDVTGVHLELEAPSAPTPVSVEAVVPVHLRGSEDRQLDMTARVHLELDDEARWRLHRDARDIEAWAKRAAAAAVKSALFRASWSELCFEFEAFERLMAASLERDATGVGYRLRTWLAEPPGGRHRELQPFLVDVSESFPTALVRVPVGVKVSLEAHLVDCPEARACLDRREDVPALAKELALQVVARHMNTVTPAEFYRNFWGEGSFAERLEAEVRHTLRRRLGLEVLRFTAGPGESEVYACFRDLVRAGPTEASVDIPLQTFGVVPYRVSVQVVDVHPDGWDRFQNIRPGIEMIGRVMSDTLHHLRDTGAVSLNDPWLPAGPWARAVAQEVPRRLAAQLGVVVQLSSAAVRALPAGTPPASPPISVGPTPTGIEDLDTRIARLEKERSTAKLRGRPEEVAALDRQIAELTARRDQQSTALAAASQDPFRLGWP